MEWTAGKGTTALGIIGTTLGGLAVAGAPLLGGVMGRGAAAAAEAGCSDNHLVNRYEAGLQARIAELETGKKLLEANTYTDSKSLQLYQYIDGRLRGIESEIAAQAVTNQRTADSFALAKADLAAVDARLTGEIAMERERRCCAANYAKSSAGRTALEKIINGEDYAQAIADMEAEWSAYCDAHIWD